MNNLVDKMSQENAKARTGVGVIFADLNGLKTINDEHGHGVGDALLKDAAKALNEVFDKAGFTYSMHGPFRQHLAMHDI